MKSSLIAFNYGNYAVRTQEINNQVWFSAQDVCEVLGIKNHRDSLAHLDADEKGVVSTDTLGGNQKILAVNESGLYALVLRSRKPEARKFAKWVTSEVLPSIRKTGGYSEEPKQLPLKYKRLLVCVGHDGKHGSVVEVPSDAFMTTHEQIAELILIRGVDAPFHINSVLKIMDACLDRISPVWSAREDQKRLGGLQ